MWILTSATFRDNGVFDFQPARWAPGGHLQTVVGYYFPAPEQLHQTQFHTVKLDDGDALKLCENQPESNTKIRGVALLMHGLGGTAQSPYLRRAAMCFREHGWIVFRMNHRGCGEGRGLARKLYHSGKSDDVSQALQHIAKLYPALPLVAVGFSLSGNALLKLLGEKIYPWNLTLRQFDEMCTAPLNGFASAEDYYQKCSARQFLDDISHPAFLLATNNDPFIPAETFRDLPRHKFLQTQITHSGGHMGLVPAEKTPLGNRQWLEYTVLSWAQRFIATGG
jgi:predicted alpha/beta-fold hydrolase